MSQILQIPPEDCLTACEEVWPPSPGLSPLNKGHQTHHSLHEFCHVMLVVFTQWCLTLCAPLDYRLPGSSVRGTVHARTLESVAIASSKGSSQPRDQTMSPVSPALQADSLRLSHQGSRIWHQLCKRILNLHNCFYNVLSAWNSFPF